jgi:hypothetical protein
VLEEVPPEVLVPRGHGAGTIGLDAVADKTLALRRYRAAMRAWVSEATATFLAAAGEDLQRQLGSTGFVEAMRTDAGSDGAITLVAMVRLGASTIRLSGTGEGLVAAYGDLHRHMPQALLEGAFRNYMASRGANA